jgi:MinD-like ATPase involved in chromosome partitioning or flagellar assembly
VYIVTFYSFKGGTGRSMALVNAAVELVKTGRRVLVVDFDLEAPGLDTFNLPQPHTPTKGIIDFVLQYLKTSKAPDVSEFLYRSPIVGTNGQLWVMPAGLPDEDYDAKFKSIDWQQLYSDRDGYFLFEDLKVQWNRFLQPDYVFIDSRTGYTDVGGICTRQLPDAVVLFFFPNEQNRRGLETVVRQVRGEENSQRKKEIKLRFVMSNVPELDDEEEFLAKNVAKFKATLGFRSFLGIIHQYPSLALVTQTIFTLDRTRTRLAQEYAKLAAAIRRDNPEDPEAAIEFLDEIAPLSRSSHLPAKELEERIQDIRSRHSGNPEIVLRLAVLLRRQRRFDEALALLEQAGESGARSSEFLLARAELYSITHNSAAAVSDLTRFLKANDANYVDVSAAARLLVRLDLSLLTSLPQSPVFLKLGHDEKFLIARELFYSRRSLPVVRQILQNLLQRPDLPVDFEDQVKAELILALVGGGRYQGAIDILTQGGERDFMQLELSDAFNLAMARWGLESKPTPELFAKVLETTPHSEGAHSSANFKQCCAIASWAVNQTESAKRYIDEAWQTMVSHPRTEFSCWSYLHVTPDRFLQDVNEMRQLIRGEPIVPRFLQQDSSETAEVAQ